jgi:hypothetical protein
LIILGLLWPLWFKRGVITGAAGKHIESSITVMISLRLGSVLLDCDQLLRHSSVEFPPDLVRYSRAIGAFLVGLKFLHLAGWY